jgi:S1-C subfamily serine protease
MKAARSVAVQLRGRASGQSRAHDLAADAAGSKSRYWLGMLAIIVSALMIQSRPVLGNDNTIALYQPRDSSLDNPRLRSLGEYVRGGVIQDSLLGIALREDERKLKSGLPARGVLIMDVTNGSPAASAGLSAAQEAPKQVVTGLVVAGSMAFPPAIILLPVLASLPLGRDGDFIIAVDGSRVRSILDFEDAVRYARPGQIVYFTIIRGSAKLQVPVNIPAANNERAPD